MSDEQWLTKADLADRLAVSERTVTNWIARGWLRAYRLGSSVRIDPKDVEDFLEERMTTSKEER